MSNEVNSKYDVTDLTSLEKLEPVRIRPGMYIGSTGTKGLHHCIWEILDNSIDEISNGFGNKATIIINKDKSNSQKLELEKEKFLIMAELKRLEILTKNNGSDEKGEENEDINIKLKNWENELWKKD